MNSQEKNWYALYTKPRAEKKVAETLVNLGFENYLPLQTTIKQWSDRKKKVEEPIFKSYIFIKTNLEKSYYDILNIKGVVKFVKIGSDIVPVRDSIIEAIKLSLLHFSDINLTPISLPKNQEVEVIAGPLKGARGFVVEQGNNQYFAINIEQLGTSIQVKIPSSYLIPLPAKFT